MRKKMLFCALILFIFFTGCEMPDAGNSKSVTEVSHSPHIDKMYIAKSIDAYNRGVYETTLVVGKTYILGFSLYDEDLDASKVSVYQERTSDGFTVSPIIQSLDKQKSSTTVYYFQFVCQYSGTWNVKLFVYDSENNKSNIITKLYTVDSRVPVISDLVAAVSLNDLNKGNYVNTLTVGNSYWFGFRVVDDDLDVKSAYITQTETTTGDSIPTQKLSLSAQKGNDVTYYTEIKIDYPGNWKVEIYVVDAANHKSNTVSATYVVKKSENKTTSNSDAQSTILHLVADDDKNTYLGILGNENELDSVANKYGTYGSPYSVNSIMNKYGTYGSDYSMYSPFNQYGTRAPWIVADDGTKVARLSVNKYASGVTEESYNLAVTLKAWRDSL